MTSRDLTIGETRVELLSDGIFETGRDVIVHRGGEAERQRVLDAWGEAPLRLDVNVGLLRGPRGTELVDAGTGSAWGAGLGHARAALAERGVAPEAVDRVFLTHFHGDHALGLLDGDAPALPGAEILVPAADLAFFTDASQRARLPVARQAAFDVARRVVAAYGDRLHGLPYGPVLPGVELLPLPGHTPGQGGFLFTAGDAGLLMLADALHLGDLQPGDPDIGLAFDVDPAAAAVTRRAILARAAAEGWIVGGGHLPGFGRVEAGASGFRIAWL